MPSSINCRKKQEQNNYLEKRLLEQYRSLFLFYRMATTGAWKLESGIVT